LVLLAYSMRQLVMFSSPDDAVVNEPIDDGGGGHGGPLKTASHLILCLFTICNQRVGDSTPSASSIQDFD
jgi:hypothetical protein